MKEIRVMLGEQPEEHNCAQLFFRHVLADRVDPVVLATIELLDLLCVPDSSLLGVFLPQSLIFLLPKLMAVLYLELPALPP